MLWKPAVDFVLSIFLSSIENFEFVFTDIKSWLERFIFQMTILHSTRDKNNVSAVGVLSLGANLRCQVGFMLIALMYCWPWKLKRLEKQVKLNKKW